jgi:hypothetical protein
METKRLTPLGDGMFALTNVREATMEEFSHSVKKDGFCFPSLGETRLQYVARNLYIEAMNESEKYNRGVARLRWDANNLIDPQSREMWFIKAQIFLDRMPKG